MTVEERIERLEKALVKLADIFSGHTHETNDLGSEELSDSDYVEAQQIALDLE